jgi:hypothetical protein
VNRRLFGRGKGGEVGAPTVGGSSSGGGNGSSGNPSADADAATFQDAAPPPDAGVDASGDDAATSGD